MKDLIRLIVRREMQLEEEKEKGTIVECMSCGFLVSVCFFDAQGAVCLDCRKKAMQAGCEHATMEAMEDLIRWEMQLEEEKKKGTIAECMSCGLLVSVCCFDAQGVCLPCRRVIYRPAHGLQAGLTAQSSTDPFAGSSTGQQPAAAADTARPEVSAPATAADTNRPAIWL